MFRRIVCFILCSGISLQAAAQEEGPVQYAIAIHGGAGGSERLSEEDRRARESSLRQALETGQKILADGGSSLDAVEQVVRLLEDDPQFNAGRGAVYNSDGGHELDASIMDGRTLACGAVGGVRTVKHPISLARLVMTQTRHVLLVADGAERFADEMKIDRVDPEYFHTERQHRNWARAREAAAAQQEEQDSHKGTVGCVALDRHGNLAAGTSTGGLTNKKFGRVGDSPIIGAGTYADNRTCGVSCTGIGEQFIRHAVAFDVAARMAYQQKSLEDAASAVIDDTLDRGDGGLIAVDRRGSIVMKFNTPGMARAAADSAGRFEVHAQ